MARDGEEVLYDEEFDFVDDDEELEDEEEEEEEDEEEAAEEALDDEGEEGESADGEEPVDEYGRPETPPANYVVHVYEHKKFTRTIERPFTAEDAEAFATEFNRTSKNYGRIAVTSKNDAKPKKTID